MRELYLITPEGKKVQVANFDKIQANPNGAVFFLASNFIVAQMPPQSIWVGY